MHEKFLIKNTKDNNYNVCVVLLLHVFTKHMQFCGSKICETSITCDYTINSYRAAACDVICLGAVVLPGGKTMECLYGNGRRFALFLLTSPALVIEHLQY